MTRAARFTVVALAALATLAAGVAWLAFPHRGSAPSTAEPARPGASTGALSPPTSIESTSATLHGDPEPPPIDAARVLADPCSVLTPALRRAVAVDGDRAEDGRGRCSAGSGDAVLAVSVRVPSSSDLSVTGPEFELENDEQAEAVGNLAFVYQRQLRGHVVLSVVGREVIVSLSVPGTDLESAVVEAFVEALR